MAETRKYDPTTGDPIGDAVRKALGETIRPNVPGQAASGACSADGCGTPTSASAPVIKPLGTFVFSSVPKPKPDADRA
ncbi:hypothetical protein [Propioniciclava tarda]|uniref:Uncharacterized protein n=1 Tax=Propioniciclava tarda TaxID=433330 RepID=A0A4Q9KNP7_PROTD|nr:hypothetical protein [Propioniciclava tarda]TBT96227.1 hypothetical protein ET996_00715 [Propioniciclava tarda]SMO33849.1 hypothetical protein SAMN06266982_101146 [Propioniciclava tarda]HOA88520.1 hypothetical protein [Propioniciclava tarda]HQA30126.1 hypothetical protein [Propioniciclava tarda]HQD60523.1 hypothetical protein [Propioniciclava tarda]